jgi:hypothetical protein
MVTVHWAGFVVFGLIAFVLGYWSGGGLDR